MRQRPALWEFTNTNGSTALGFMTGFTGQGAVLPSQDGEVFEFSVPEGRPQTEAGTKRKVDRMKPLIGGFFLLRGSRMFAGGVKMTLGQKLKVLLKDNGMTQEDLAERLDVSRQAVGKWVNDKGIPEVGKLVQISNLFGVSLDYLLKEDCEEKIVSEGRDISNIGYYVSQEMLDGYLSYSRHTVNQIVGGISLFIVSSAFECFGQQNTIMYLLYWITMAAGIIIIIWHLLQIRQYQEIKNERLTFDDKVFEEFKRQQENRRKKYAFTIIVGVVILLAGSEMERLIMTEFGQIAGNVSGWVADTAWMALIIWAGMSMHVDGVIIKNAQHAPESGHMKRYRWIYMALPVTVAAVLIGVITNAWSPYAPIVILFCCLLVTTCKLIIESRGER